MPWPIRITNTSSRAAKAAPSTASPFCRESNQSIIPSHLKRIAVRTPNRGCGKVLLEYAMSRAFLHHRAHRLWLDVFETNTRARSIYESYGFRYDGVLREAILRDGEYHTLALMSLLDREYTARQQQGANSVTSAIRL